MIVLGLMMVLSLTLISAIPAMAMTDEYYNGPHYNVNLVTELTDPTQEILMPKFVEEADKIQIAFVHTDVPTIQIVDGDGTDGYAEVWIPYGYSYDFFAQARGKPGNSCEINWQPMIVKSDWTWFMSAYSSSGGATGYAYYTNDGSQNCAIRINYTYGYVPWEP